jgi:hypothetical protein
MGFFDYLLAGGVGAAQGYEARQERLQKEEEERKAQQRQAMYDTLQLLDRGALPSAQRQAAGQAAAGEIAKAVSGAMGAFQGGPMTPFDSEAIARGAGRMGTPAAQFKIGDVTFDMPDPEQRRKASEAQASAARLRERTDLARMEEENKIRADQREIQRIKDLSAGAKRGGRNSEAAIELAVVSPQAYNAIFPDLTRGADRSMTEYQRTALQQEMDAAEAFFNTPEADPKKRRLIAQTFNNLRSARPNAPARELILATYQAIKAREASDYREAQTGASIARTDVTKAKAAGRAPMSPPPGFGTDATAAVPQVKEQTEEEKRVAQEKERLRKLYPQLDTIMRR